MGLVITVQGDEAEAWQSELISDDLPSRMNRYGRGTALKGEDSHDSEHLQIEARVGQCWEVDGKALEITGFKKDSVEYLEWSATGNTLAVGGPLFVDTSDNYAKYPMGLGTNLTISKEDLSHSVKLIEREPEPRTMEKRSIVVSDDNRDQIVTRDTLTSKISGIRNRSPKFNPPRVKPPSTSHKELENIHFDAVYTDGSWSRTDTVSSLLLGCGAIKTAGALVLHTPRGMINVKVVMDIDVHSAYEAELISLLIAHELSKGRPITIWTDCESAMKRLNGAGLGSLAQVLSGWRKNPRTLFRKVKAHPEKRIPLASWSMEEKGNFMADQVAGDILPPAFTIHASEWLKRIGAAHSKLVIERTNGTPMIMDVSAIKSKVDVINYLEERDEYRAKDKKDRVWKGANISLHHKLLGRSNKIGDRVITQRIGLGKRWQWHSSRPDNLCQGCMELISDIRHPLRHCKVDEMIKARDLLWTQVDICINKAPRNLHNVLHSIARHMREDEGGDIACCGTFRCDLVNALPCANLPIAEMEGKIIIKLLKTIAAGTRRLLRLAAEIQLGPLGVNFRQTALHEYFKPLPAAPTKVLEVRKKNWWDTPAADMMDTPASTPSTSNSKNTTSKSIVKNTTEPDNKNIMKTKKNNKRNKNSTITRIAIEDIFVLTPISGTMYWEMKAG